MSTPVTNDTPHLESEFEHEPVPQEHRKSLLTVSAVWIGFPMILTNAVPGGLVVAALGFRSGIAAIIVANIIMAVYVGLLSYRAGQTGKNFALQTTETFGTVGYTIASGFLATIVVGWFAFNTGATGSALHNSFGWNEPLVAFIVGIAFIAVTFVGFKALSLLSGLAAPLFVVALVVALVIGAQTNDFSQVVSYPGVGGGMTFGIAVTAIMATFLDSGTMAADFTRWSKNGRQGVIATATAFPFASLVAQVGGGVAVAAGLIANASVNGGDFTPILTGPNNWLLNVLVVVFVIINLGSVCTHCLYNGALSWSHITRSKMRLLTLILGAVGLAAAVLGAWHYYVSWLALLGVIVPPLGAILIADQIVLAKRLRNRPQRRVRASAFIAWGAGALVALIVHQFVPVLSDAVVGLLVGFVVYLAIEGPQKAASGTTVQPESAINPATPAR
ncbi:purine-cytosine permease family protein [Tessaracoccus antarcticus]|uniref:Cytosine permease n=1 Tax=Tessaracoccus antarcticus TaxID=2479848 RepID=A0A3M0GIW9_9ACTN|nr:cytosine permease [Tessaracoccus antarcticus]RMB61563.1 cytosine permease [Tessaracoccus antarcticus]